MSILAPILKAVGDYDRFVEEQVRRARRDPKFARDLRRRWRALEKGVEIVTTPTGLQLPGLALPQTDEPAQIARYLFGEGAPGEFPFVNSAYRRMYLEQSGVGAEHKTEEPTRLFAGLGLAD